MPGPTVHRETNPIPSPLHAFLNTWAIPNPTIEKEPTLDAPPSGPASVPKGSRKTAKSHESSPPNEAALAHPATTRFMLQQPNSYSDPTNHDSPRAWSISCCVAPHKAHVDSDFNHKKVANRLESIRRCGMCLPVLPLSMSHYLCFERLTAHNSCHLTEWPSIAGDTHHSCDVHIRDDCPVSGLGRVSFAIPGGPDNW